MSVVVAHERDDAEVGEHVERDEQRPSRDAGPIAGSVTRASGTGSRDAEAARGLLERRVELAQRCRVSRYTYG